jgi:hypothetical protein
MADGSISRCGVGGVACTARVRGIRGCIHVLRRRCYLQIHRPIQVSGVPLTIARSCHVALGSSAASLAVSRLKAIVWPLELNPFGRHYPLSLQLNCDGMPMTSRNQDRISWGA